LGGNRTLAIFKSSSGRIWVSDTSPALNEFDGETFRSYPIKQFTGTDHIATIAEDTDGNLWLGTSANGVLRFARQGFVTYDTTDGLGEVIGSIFENHAGELYVTSRNWIISRFDGEKFISVKPGLPNSVICLTLRPGISSTTRLRTD
jgi:ligand-binding sensor domain-containing protein